MTLDYTWKIEPLPIDRLPIDRGDPLDCVLLPGAPEKTGPILTSDAVFRKHPLHVIW